MNNAIERLAADLMKLSADEWARLDERRIASQDRDTVLGQAAEAELAERLRELDRIAARIKGTGESLAEGIPTIEPESREPT